MAHIPRHAPRGPRHLRLPAALLALLFIACADSDTSGDTTPTVPETTSDVPLFPDVADAAPPDTALDTNPETSDSSDSQNPIDTVDQVDSTDLALAGSADGTRPWTIDNFLLIERFDTDPEAGPATPSASWLTTSTGATAPGRYADQSPITIIKHASLPGDLTGSRTPSAFSFPANVLQLDPLMPVGARAWFRFTGLDTGVAGHLSRLFIVSHTTDTTVPECRTHLDCPRPDATNGFAIAIRSGCLSGRCEPAACPRCPGVHDRCWYGYCRQCEIDDHCPSGQRCADTTCVPR